MIRSLTQRDQTRLPVALCDQSLHAVTCSNATRTALSSSTGFGVGTSAPAQPDRDTSFTPVFTVAGRQAEQVSAVWSPASVLRARRRSQHAGRVEVWRVRRADVQAVKGLRWAFLRNRGHFRAVRRVHCPDDALVNYPVWDDRNAARTSSSVVAFPPPESSCQNDHPFVFILRPVIVSRATSAAREQVS